MLAQHFHADRALAGDDIGVIEGMHEGELIAGLHFERMGVGIRVGVAVQHHLRAARQHRIDLDLRCGHRHHDDRAATEPAGGQCHALRMVAGRGGDHAGGKLLRRQMRHLVVGTAQLEGEDRLQVFALEHHRAADSGGQGLGALQRGFEGDVVDARGQDSFEIFGRHKTFDSTRRHKLFGCNPSSTTCWLGMPCPKTAC